MTLFNKNNVITSLITKSALSTSADVASSAVSIPSMSPPLSPSSTTADSLSEMDISTCTDYSMCEFEEDCFPEHPEELLLENSWSIWYDKYAGPGLTAQQYENALKNIGTFSSVPDFWRWFNNLPEPEKLGPRSSFHLMKKGVKPLWEDKENSSGGHLSIKIRKDQTPYVWLRLLTAVVGEQLSFAYSDSDAINGVTCSIRKTENVIDIWNKSARLMSTDLVLKRLKELIPDAEFSSPCYKVHSNESDFKK